MTTDIWNINGISRWIVYGEHLSDGENYDAQIRKILNLLTCRAYLHLYFASIQHAYLRGIITLQIMVYKYNSCSKH